MRKRKSYKRETIESTTTTKNVVSINPYLIQCENKITGQKSIYDATSLNESPFKELSLGMAKYLQAHCNKSSGIRGTKATLNIFLNFTSELGLENINQIDFIVLTKYKYYIEDSYKAQNTKRSRYSCIISLLNYLQRNALADLHQDIINDDVPKNFSSETKSAAEKDMEHQNKAYSDEYFKEYLDSAINIICNEKSNHHDKITSFLVIMALITGANGEVLLKLDDKDLSLLANDFEYLDLTKEKSRKGQGGAPIKVTLKNYVLNNVKISDLATIVKNSKTSYICEFENEKFKELLFIYPRLRKGSATSTWSMLNANAAPAQIKRMFTRYDTNIDSSFTFGKSRKYFERKINSITQDTSITSSLMGHSKQVANKHYLNTSASIESHQKLALTQDIVKGFSVNDKTDNFVIYQKLLKLYDLDLSKALELANNGFPIEEIIIKAKREV